MALSFISLPLLTPLTHNLTRQSLKPPVYGTHKGLRISCSVSTDTSPYRNERRSANYQPTIWSYNFVQSLKIDHAEDICKDKADKLKDKVKCMLDDEDAEFLTILELIDDIQRLGLGYRLKEDIKKALERFESSINGYSFDTEKSLHATSLSFRLLRQHGYEVSQDLFKSFMDNEDEFKESLGKDIKGMLSLYEASHLAFEGEDVLDKALAFTRNHLKDLNGNTDSSIAELVSHGLELPLWRRMPRQEARWYIEAYSKKQGANGILLELAQLDFNMVQSVLQSDLQEMSRWWKDLGLANKLEFARDRIMECFFWTVGMTFEPQFSRCRKGLTKVTSLITTIDDVYDVYGTLDELEQFTNAVERWDINAMTSLPDYMKLCFLALYNTINEMAYDTLKEQGTNIIPYLTKAWANLCKTFLQEARWGYDKYTPTFEEYFENAWRSVSGVVILTHAYFLLDQSISKEGLDSLENYHDLLRSPSIIFRLLNDLGTSSAELERGEAANSISCYMHETGMSEDVARRHISDLIDKAWKKMNKDRVEESSFAKSFVETAVNLARISHCTYQDGDAHGAPDGRSKNRVLSLIIEPISLMPTGKKLL